MFEVKVLVHLKAVVCGNLILKKFEKKYVNIHLKKGNNCMLNIYVLSVENYNF